MAKKAALTEVSNADLIAEVLRRVVPNPEGVKVEIQEGEAVQLTTLDVTSENAGATIGREGVRIRGLKALTIGMAAKAGRQRAGFTFLIDGKKPERKTKTENKTEEK